MISCSVNMIESETNFDLFVCFNRVSATLAVGMSVGRSVYPTVGPSVCLSYY